MKKFGKTLITVVALLLILMFFLFMKMGSEMHSLEYSEVDMNEVEDGVYRGSAETTLVKAEVEVEVKNDKIISIDILRHDNGRGEEAEKIINDMIDKNTYDVDTISGATASSEVLKSAVSNSLGSGDKEGR